MSLEVFKTVEKIGGFRIVDMDLLREKYPEKFNESGAMNYEWFEKEIRPHNYIYVRRDVNSISFVLQNGPIKEVGLNGCQIDTIIESALLILKSFQDTFPCKENAVAITKLEEALMWLGKRTADREKREVEGTNNM